MFSRRNLDVLTLTLNGRQQSAHVLQMLQRVVWAHRLSSRRADWGGVVWECKAIIQGVLNNRGGFLESLLAILFVHGRVMQAWVVAALNHHGD